MSPFGNRVRAIFNGRSKYFYPKGVSNLRMGEWRGCGHKVCRMPTGFTFWYKSGYEASAAAKQKDKGERALPAHSVELSRSVTAYKALQGKFYSEMMKITHLWNPLVQCEK